jgi:ribonuclease HII
LVAKVERDRYMNKLAGMYPQYGFDKHKWYGTAFHRRMIVDYGLTRYHRVTYCIKTLQSTYLS